jgi:hypothetical protein
MATNMHRLQISLPRRQMQYLAARARREGVSVAGLIRAMIQREAEREPRRGVDSLWEIVGIGEETEPLTGGVPVSEDPALYLAEIRRSRGQAPSTRGRRPCGR